MSAETVLVVYLLSTGSGSPGDEWSLLGVYSTLDKAEDAKKHYERKLLRLNGTSYRRSSTIEEYPLNMLPR